MASVAGARVISARCALAKRTPIGTPRPSTTTIHLVPLPFRVNPTAAPPFLRARSSCPGRPGPKPASPGHPGRRGVSSRYAPRCHPPASGRARRQQVLGAPYRRGISCQRHPDRSTCRIPLSVVRSSAQGLPRRLRAGSRGATTAHWLSVNSACMVKPPLRVLDHSLKLSLAFWNSF